MNARELFNGPPSNSRIRLFQQRLSLHRVSGPQPPHWLPRPGARRAALLALAAGMSVSAVLLVREARPAARPATPLQGAATIARPSVLGTPAVRMAAAPAAAAPAALAPSSSQAGAGAGATLGNGTLGDGTFVVGESPDLIKEAQAAVADAALYARLQTEMAAPPAPAAPSALVLGQLAQLVQQAQAGSLAAAPVATAVSPSAAVSTAPVTASVTAAPTADSGSAALASAEAGVRDAQAALAAAVAVRDHAGASATATPAALIGGAARPTPALSTAAAAVVPATAVTTTAASVAPAATAATITAASVAPAAAGTAVVTTALPTNSPLAAQPQLQATPPSSAAVLQAKAALQTAQQQLNTLVALPSASAVAAAQKEISDALAKTPAAPSAADLKSAQDAVDQAQTLYNTVSQPASEAAIAQARNAASDAGGIAVPEPSPVSSAVPAPASASSAGQIAAQNALDQLLHGPDPQRVAEAKQNLDNMEQYLASLQEKAAYAANPDSQPSVIAARKALATLLAPPDPAKVAAAQAAVQAAEHQLDALQPTVTPAPAAAAQTNPAPSVTAPSVISSTLATSATAAAASTPGAVLPKSAASAPPSQPTATDAASSDPAQAAVDAAAAKLTAAQAHLRRIVTAAAPASAAAPPTASATTAAAQDVPAAVLPAGSAVTQLTPTLTRSLNSARQLTAASSTALTLSEVALRADLVKDAVLTSLHLHPSAMDSLSGLAAPTATGGSALTGFGWPALGPITQPFGVPELGVGAPHTGIDIGQPAGEPVIAAAEGVVSFTGGNPLTSYGYYVIVEHGNGISTLYGHFALPPFVRVGQMVFRGSLLGLSGSTGFSTGPHVHFEVRVNGVPINPLLVLPSTQTG